MANFMPRQAYYGRHMERELEIEASSRRRHWARRAIRCVAVDTLHGASIGVRVSAETVYLYTFVVVVATFERSVQTQKRIKLIFWLTFVKAGKMAELV
jgi:hypothetical protein